MWSDSLTVALSTTVVLPSHRWFEKAPSERRGGRRSPTFVPKALWEVLCLSYVYPDSKCFSVRLRAVPTLSQTTNALLVVVEEEVNRSFSLSTILVSIFGDTPSQCGPGGGDVVHYNVTRMTRNELDRR